MVMGGLVYAPGSVKYKRRIKGEEKERESETFLDTVAFCFIAYDIQRCVFWIYLQARVVMQEMGGSSSGLLTFTLNPSSRRALSGPGCVRSDHHYRRSPMSGLHSVLNHATGRRRVAFARLELLRYHVEFILNVLWRYWGVLCTPL